MTTSAILFTIVDSTLGRLLVARSDVGLCAVLPGDADAVLEADLRARLPAHVVLRNDDAVAPLADSVRRCIEGVAQPDFELDLRGTDFQRSVWRALRQVPAGATASYTEIAERIGRPQSVRAVAQACAANALAVVVPCHRAVRLDGGLSGYRWGIERKRALLEREGVAYSV